ncbi:uncharacterized protein LOC121868817 [Homarus americanus]|uniref:Cysteine-rich protein 2-binding protein-like 1 n=1 Tax=Homarus americanus TaxID=6706 RepID=A0A8J5JYR1_HOMAM|nr:uncharacterized protein LOC121868817 [Homarus americanus]KAG7167087.1 Cysteine-rich protein 2-binding protein-like 1 [Homarus americanus]
MDHKQEVEFIPNGIIGPCDRCGRSSPGPEYLLYCTDCRELVHIECLRSKPECRLAGDNFYTFTCFKCHSGKKDTVARPKDLSKLQALLVVLFHLHKTAAESSHQGFFHADDHISQFIINYWNDIFGSNNSTKQGTTNDDWGSIFSVQDILSKQPQYFVKGPESLGGGPWYKLSPMLPPAQLLHASLQVDIGVTNVKEAGEEVLQMKSLLGSTTDDPSGSAGNDVCAPAGNNMNGSAGTDPHGPAGNYPSCSVENDVKGFTRKRFRADTDEDSTRVSQVENINSSLSLVHVKSEPTDVCISSSSNSDNSPCQNAVKQELVYKEEVFVDDFVSEEVNKQDPLSLTDKSQVIEPSTVTSEETWPHSGSEKLKECRKRSKRISQQPSRLIQPKILAVPQVLPVSIEELANTQEAVGENVPEVFVAQHFDYHDAKLATSWHLIEDMLPAIFSHKVITYDYMSDNNLPGFNLEIDSTVSTKDDIGLWLHEFSERTQTKWKLRYWAMGNTYSYTYKVMYVCASAPRTKKEKSKFDRSCKAFIHIKLYEEDILRKVNAISVGFLSRISLSYIHNHPVMFKETFQYKSVRKDMIEMFHEYFAEGHTSVSAHHYHEARLWLRDLAAELLLDDTIHPKIRTIKYMKEQWVKSNSATVLKNKNNETGEALFNAACERVEELSHQRKVQYFIVKNPFSVALVTPLMKRVHSLQEASLTLFVNTVINCGREKCSITYFTCASVAGVLPLGVVIVSNPTCSALKIAFKNLVTTVGETAFGGRGSPMVIISDGFEPQMEALKSCFPYSQTLLCVTNLVHSVWRWLTEESNGIKEHHWVTLIGLVKNVLYAPTPEVSKLAYRMMLAHSVSKQYEVFNTYLATLWHRRGEVGLVYKLPMNNKDFVELSRRIFIDAILTRCQAFSVLPMMRYVCIALEECFQSRVSEYIENTASQFTFLKCMEKTILPETKNMQSSHKVRSTQDEDDWCTVNCEASLCSCVSGSLGGFCEHQRAVWKQQHLQLPAAPEIDSRGKVQLADIAFGEAGYQSFNRMEYDVTINALKKNLARIETIASQNITNSFIGKMRKLNQTLDKITTLDELGMFCELAGILGNVQTHVKIMQPQTNILQQAKIVQSQANIVQSQPSIVQPQNNSVQPQATIVQSQTVQPQANLVQPQTSLMQAQASLMQPQPNLLQPQTNILQPQTSFVQSQTSLMQPQTNAGLNPIQFLVVQSIQK